MADIVNLPARSEAMIADDATYAAIIRGQLRRALADFATLPVADLRESESRYLIGHSINLMIDLTRDAGL